MNITIIGSGNMARAIATRAVQGGHSVILAARDLPEAADLAREIAPQAIRGATIKAVAYGASLPGEIVVLAVPYSSALAVVQESSAQLAGKIVIDISNPLNATYDGLATPPDASAAEQIAKAAPSAKVVKAFNMTFAGPLREGQVDGQPLDVFIAGDDADAKKSVVQLATDGGLRAVDMGPLSRSRQLEQLGFLNIQLALQRGMQFNTALKLIGYTA